MASRCFHKNKEELIAAMNLAVQKYPGAIWNFSQPIEDNVGETMTGAKVHSHSRFLAMT